MVDGGKGNGKEHREFFLFNTELFVFLFFFWFWYFILFFCFIKHGGALFNMVVPVCFFYFFWFCFFYFFVLLFFLTLC